MRIHGVPHLLLSSLFPSYKLSRARAWLNNYAPGSITFHLSEEWVTENAYTRCSADIDRVDPNRIQEDVVYARILDSHGYDSAEAFMKELTRMRSRNG